LGRRFRKIDDGGGTHGAARVSDGEAVVSARCRDDPAFGLIARKREQAIEGTAWLEGPRDLRTFQFQPQLSIEPIIGAWRDHHTSFEAGALRDESWFEPQDGRTDDAIFDTRLRRFEGCAVQAVGEVHGRELRRDRWYEIPMQVAVVQLSSQDDVATN